MMENRSEIVKELHDISPFLADTQPVTPYSVPANYFDALPGIILDKAKTETLFTAASGNTYNVPAGYFDGLAGNILDRIKADISDNTDTKNELAEIAPLLNTIGKHEVYTVAAGYFENKDFTTLAKPQAKLVSMRRANRWMQYAAAAVMAGVLVTGAFLYTDNNGKKGDEQYEPIDLSSELNKMNAEELVTYLNNPEHITATTLLGSGTEPGDVKTHIQRLSDEELTNYLKENADPLDNAALEKEN